MANPAAPLALRASAQRVAIDAAVYRRLVAAKIRSDLQYRASFALFLTAQSFLAVADLGVVLVIFSTVDALAGWTATEVLFLFGVSASAFALGDCFVSPVERASRHIKDGTFDQFLIRPAGALWQLLAAGFALRSFGRLIQPAVVLAAVVFLVDVDWTPAAVALIPVAVASGTVIYGSLWVITSSLAFWTVETQEMANSFTYGGNALSKYPIDILSVTLRRVVTFVVPLAFVAYLPAAWLFAKPMPLDLPRGTAWASPAVAAALAFAARAIWRHAIRHYRSTGS